MIRTGSVWMNHLHGAFNGELIANMFIDIDKDIARNTLRKYQNNRLILNVEDSLSLKSFAGLSDNQYVKLTWGLFYFTGLKPLTPIRSICLL